MILVFPSKKRVRSNEALDHLLKGLEMMWNIRVAEAMSKTKTRDMAMGGAIRDAFSLIVICGTEPRLLRTTRTGCQRQLLQCKEV